MEEFDVMDLEQYDGKHVRVVTKDYSVTEGRAEYRDVVDGQIWVTTPGQPDDKCLFSPHTIAKIDVIGELRPSKMEVIHQWETRSFSQSQSSSTLRLLRDPSYQRKGIYLRKFHRFNIERKFYDATGLPYWGPADLSEELQVHIIDAFLSTIDEERNAI